MFRNGEEDENARGVSGSMHIWPDNEGCDEQQKSEPLFLFLHTIIQCGAPVDLKCVATMTCRSDESQKVNKEECARPPWGLPLHTKLLLLLRLRYLLLLLGVLTPVAPTRVGLDIDEAQ